ncbi:MAG: CoA transferase [Acidimicrobiia bacterium]|nr:CoA transferase [Acidimicrobiia bacterium]
MGGPMEGVRVVEVGFWVAGPSCSGILADWGADVIKVEPIAGDPFRSLDWFFEDGNPPFELDNRGKRSIALDYRSEAGARLLAELVDRADVFVSNLRPGGLARAGLDPDTLRARNPRLVYASVTGYGLDGPDRDRPAYDIGAFWSRAGVAAALTTEEMPLPYQRGGMGDHMTGMSAAGAVAAALFARERTGQGQLVRASLLRLGLYMVGWDANINLRSGLPTVPTSIDSPANPLINAYTCADGRAIWLLCLEGDRHWPDVVRAFERPDWLEDPRYTDIVSRKDHAAALVEELREIFATRPRAEWEEVLDRHEVWWAPVQHTHEAVDDVQVRANRGVVEVPIGDGSMASMVATPVDFEGTPWGVRSMPPELGQHTELILAEELGLGWDEIDALRESGVIP